MRPHIKRRVEVTTKDTDCVQADVITVEQGRGTALTQTRVGFRCLSERGI